MTSVAELAGRRAGQLKHHSSLQREFVVEVSDQEVGRAAAVEIS